MIDEKIHTYYQQLATSYDSDRFANSYGKYIHTQEHSILSRHLKNIAPASVLDLGCGTGRLLNFADYGVDFSQNMIEQAQQKHPHKNLSVSQAEQTHFDEQKFQCVFSFHVIMHLDDNKLEHILKEVHRILIKGGRFIFDVPSKKRRLLFRNKKTGWHAANDYSTQDIKTIIEKHWGLKSSIGVLFLPIHRIPKSIRWIFRGIDNLLCRTVLKSYASYIVFELEKKCD